MNSAIGRRSRTQRFLPAALGALLAVLSAGSLWVSGDVLDAGGYRRLDEEQAGSATSLAAKRLLARPASARRWIQSGQTLFAERQPERARLCFDEAVKLAPHSPPILLEAAFFYRTLDRECESLAMMARVLAATRAYDDLIFRLFDATADVPTVLRLGIPGSSDTLGAYLQHLAATGDWESAGMVWTEACRRGNTPAPLLGRYLHSLLDAGRHGEAFDTMQSFLPAGERTGDGNRVTHGGFEVESTGAVLDWRVTPSPHVWARREQGSGRSGSWALRLDFDGEQNVEYRHVAQQVVVTPGRWKLRGYVRTEELTSDQGVGLRVFDVRPASRLMIWTGDVRGSSGWTRLEKEFTVPPGTQLMRVEVVRRPSERLAANVGGAAWVDEVDLTPF